jgi:hypothetical protein
MRILADFSEEDVKWLDRVAKESGRSRAAVLREAVSAYRNEAGDGELEPYFGLWKRHGHEEDGLAYQERLRSEWDRD